MTLFQICDWQEEEEAPDIEGRQLVWRQQHNQRHQQERNTPNLLRLCHIAQKNY
jgi:hypothetical protein